MFPFEITLILRRRRCMGTSPITLCYDVERLEPKTHTGLDPGESVQYTKHRVSLEGHPCLGCRPIRILGVNIVNGQTKQKRGLEQCWSSEPGKLLLSERTVACPRRDIQVVKPYKCGRRGPAGRLTNVWHRHPTGPRPGRGDASGGVDSDSDSCPLGGVC